MKNKENYFTRNPIFFKKISTNKVNPKNFIILLLDFPRNFLNHALRKKFEANP